MRSAKKRLALASGVWLEYVERGEGPAVILLHGYSDSLHSFDLLASLLPPDLRIIALSMRGHGGSDSPQAYDMDAFADDVAGVMDVLAIERAILVGHSLGSSVALAACSRHPDRVAGLALLGAFANYRDNALVQGLVAEVAALSDPVDPAFVRGFQLSTLAHPPPPTFLEAAIAESLRLPARVWQAVSAGFMAFDPLAAAARCTAPAIIVWGDKEELVSRSDGARLAEALGGASFVALSGLGHALHWEDPEAVAQPLRDFIARVHAEAESADRTATRTQPVAAASFRT